MIFSANMAIGNKTEGSDVVPDILFESDDLLVVNKPAGLLTHADGKSDEYTLADWVSERCQTCKDVGEPMILPDGSSVARPGIVHRLDRDTSGVLLIAKTQPMYLYLKRQFQDKKIRKEYRAFAYGSFAKKRGVIDKPLGRSVNRATKRAAGRAARGELREARTDYTVLEEKGGYSYLSLFPHTGRTHQIRVHLSHIRHPIVQDPTYAADRMSGAADPVLGFSRSALHAHRIHLRLPGGEEVSYEAPFPKDFTEALARFEQL
jgi:23S rRNA pseudouridine1911/1915/1917 synthase